MEALNQWVTARSCLKDAAAGFLKACLALKKVAVHSRPSHPNQIILESMIDDVQSKIESIETVERWMHASRAALNALLNHSTSRVPINKLPPEILGRIFAIIVGSTSCYMTNDGRNALLDIPLVCARWYQVATNTRPLWSHIDIYCRPKDPDSNLVRLWLQRSHGVPLHIHLSSYSFQPATTILDLVPILQPYSASTNSLLISGANDSEARALFALYLGDSGPRALSTLDVSNVWDSEATLPWPTYPIPGLTSLELCNLGDLTCPNLDELVHILSGSPRLHTLRLAKLSNFAVRPGRQQDYRTISLPHLKLLEIMVSGRNALAALLAMIHPGKLELHVRLGIQVIGEDPVPRAARLLLARSNVVSLTLSCIDSGFVPDIQSFFPCVPGLRALRIDRLDREAETFLEALAEYSTLQPLSSLQLLCLSGGEVNSRLMSRVKSIVGARQLRSLLFWSCEFPPVFRELGAEDYTPEYIDLGVIGADVDKDQLEALHQFDAEVAAEAEDDDDVDIGNFGSETCDIRFPCMLTSTREWLLEHVERLQVCETPSSLIINGIDGLAQELTRINANAYMETTP
ncbi:hypothetical protein FRC12_021785 [Ceratobasidium sp. 428]|nr:hypothetical protein FRC12_021785 [Ceratobasidium sp. 428]